MPLKPNQFDVTIAFDACGGVSVDSANGLLDAEVGDSEEVENLAPGETHTLTGELPSFSEVDRSNSWGWQRELQDSLPPYSTYRESLSYTM